MCTRLVDGKYALFLATALAVLAMPDAAGAQGYPNKFDFGASASEEDIAAVAIAIGPDGKGLPAGKGDYETGKKVYETSCSACHGANLQGVAGLPDMPAGAALRLIGGRGTLTTKNPVMTVESYWPYATTLFDYVRRAMPFQAPGSLSAEQIYAVSAYILAEGKVIDKAMVLDAQSLPQVRMPNRDGFIPDPRPEWFK
jgi:cytochrome c